MFKSDRHLQARAAPPVPSVHRGIDLKTEIVGDLAGMRALADEWRRLERETTDSFTYFQSNEWCLRWAEAFFADLRASEDIRIRILCIRRGGRLVSLWPLTACRRPLGIWLLRFMGEPHSQYGNMLIDRRRLGIAEARECWSQAMGRLDVDAIVLDRLPITGPLAQILGAGNLYREHGHVSSIMDLGQFRDWQDYGASLSRAARKSRRKRRRELESEGCVEFRIFSGGTAGFRETVARSLRLKAHWLEATGKPVSNIADSRTEAFLSALDGDADEPSGAVASALLLDGEPIATEIGFCRSGHYYSFLGAFDWDRRDFSPGKIHLEAVLKWAFDAGLSKFDLLGHPSAYKQHWSNSTAGLAGYGAARTLKGAAYARLWRPNLKPFAKQAFERLPLSFRRQVVSVLPTL
jgi:CelD/BcsL family acetyltransferase involved in cellulose biosynthesis